MSEVKMSRIDAAAMTAWAQQCAEQAGAATDVAANIAKYLVAADLMGFRTHGLVRLRYNLTCLSQGLSKPQGEPRRLSGRAALELWDADFLPGLHSMPMAITRAIAMATDYGTGTVVLRRTQHVAALAVYLEQATDAGMMVQIMCATPAQRAVAPFAGKSAWFSPNPLAIGVPTMQQPVLFDVSLSMLAAGKVRSAIAEGKPLPFPALITAAGDYTCDARTFMADPASVLAPLGGADLGYKGTGLNLYSELWTLALSQYGRHQAATDGDANTVWIQVVDPAALGDSDAFRQQAQAQVDGMCAVTPIDPRQPVRVPGSGALALREQQLQQGVEYSAAIMKQLQWCADTYHTPLPAELSGL
jgi:LDH2 family malate/lactate/ureidoglycolate dehydrogenase